MMKTFPCTALVAFCLTLVALGGCSTERDDGKYQSLRGSLSNDVHGPGPDTTPSASGPAPAVPATSPSSTGPAPAPSSGSADADSGDETDETAWKIITTTLQRDGARRVAVLVVTVPRDDLFVAIDGMDVPTAAGVESIFSFYHCSCGKTSVVGQFCVADYESNDVIDALRAGHMEVASIAPMVLHSRVSPLLLRFQGEGKAADIAKTLREALRWTGKERMAPDVPLKAN